MIDNMSISVLVFASCILTSLSVDKILLPMYVNLNDSRCLPLGMKMALSHLKHLDSGLFEFA